MKIIYKFMIPLNPLRRKPHKSVQITELSEFFTLLKGWFRAWLDETADKGLMAEKKPQLIKGLHSHPEIFNVYGVFRRIFSPYNCCRNFLHFPFMVNKNNPQLIEIYDFNLIGMDIACVKPIRSYSGLNAKPGFADTQTA